MSEAISALNNASFADGIASVSEIGPMGMITLRGDLSNAKLRQAASAIAQVDFPEQRQAHSDGVRGMAWMSPDELLVMCAYGDVAQNIATIQTRLGDAHALAVNVSDARAVFEVRGPHAREVMAKLSPVDLDPTVFEPGLFRRTRLAQVAAAFWMTDAETFRIICFRSQAQYVFDLLKVASQPGSEVGFF